MITATNIRYPPPRQRRDARHFGLQVLDALLHSRPLDGGAGFLRGAGDDHVPSDISGVDVRSWARKGGG